MASEKRERHLQREQQRSFFYSPRRWVPPRNTDGRRIAAWWDQAPCSETRARSPRCRFDSARHLAQWPPASSGVQRQAVSMTESVGNSKRCRQGIVSQLRYVWCDGCRGSGTRESTSSRRTNRPFSIASRSHLLRDAIPRFSLKSSTKHSPIYDPLGLVPPWVVCDGLESRSLRRHLGMMRIDSGGENRKAAVNCRFRATPNTRSD